MQSRRGFIATGALATGALTLPALAGCSRPEEAATTAAGSGQGPGANSPGGSNYNFFDLNGCDREPFGVLKNFHNEHETVTEQLATMHESGQRRLIVGVFHHNGPETGTMMDSTGGDIDSQYKQNLEDLLATIHEVGFVEVEVAMHVLGVSSPNDWDSWNEELYQENRQLIENLRPIVTDADVHCRLNLGNELTPAPNQPQTLEYTKRLWTDYTDAHGKEDTVGFSVIGSRSERIANIPEMYGNNPPNVFDFHFYGNDDADEYQQFVNAHNQMVDMGFEQGWVIGEVYYNDSTAAEGINRAISETGQEIYWLTQWPLTRERTCDDEGGHVDVTPPVDFDVLSNAGF